MQSRYRRVLVCAALLSAFGTPHTYAQSKFIDDAQRVVELPKTVTRVFAAGAPAEVLLYTLTPDKLVGRNHQPPRAALEFMPPELRNPIAIAKLPRSQDASNDTELLALKPDVYIDYGDLHQDYIDSVGNVQRRTGVPGIILDGHLEAIPATYRRLGAALQVKRRGDILAKSVDQLLKKYRGTLKKSGAVPRVYLACSGDAMIPCLEGEKMGEVAQFLGAVNVAGKIGDAPIKPLTMEEIEAWNPEVIIAASADAAARILQDVNWRSIKAIKEKRVYAAPTLPFNWGSRPPSVTRLPGLIWLAYALPGREFDTAFYSDIRSFFKLFYHVNPTDEQLKMLVQPRS